MSEIDVEAVERIEEGASPPDGPEYVLYGGKGGVGKTTMAAATALASARGGTSTLVVSTDPAHSLSDAFEASVPPEPGRIREDVPLYGVEIDPERAVEESGMFGTGENPLGGVGEMLGGGEAGDLLGGRSTPGADEVAAMRLLLAYLDDERFERVVVDTAPTGHTLRLLELPDLLDSMVGKLLTFRQRIQGLFEGMTGMFGSHEDVDVEEGVDDLQALGDRIERLRDLLQDPTKTDFRIVLVPEAMSVVESQRLREDLQAVDIPVGTVVVNRVMEDLGDVVEGADAAGLVGPTLDDCAFCQRRWDVQQDALRRAQELFRDHEVRRVPLFADEVRGERMLRVVAACLE
ncbi:arsenic-transporting ATPase [Halobacteriales archaeon QS_1_68_20]|nr:MAG: arsenic-transporting ATPase [Halobacteriales archaeon QS_1_68_20]